MAETRAFQLEVFLHNGVRLQTTFNQLLEEGQLPSTRFYLGYSNDSATVQDLPWIAVGDIAYMPDEAVAVRLVPLERAQQELPLRALEKLS